MIDIIYYIVFINDVIAFCCFSQSGRNMPIRTNRDFGQKSNI